ncbi:MAG TPA: PfkB family carbohydrate kinase, partial [Fimbriimonas sp.]|nr:PfkB family carbohydrate kinase [Fimbriimonas sp.]
MSPGELLRLFQGRRALVVGDLMLDEYIFGKATRISQEAPVMVVRQTSTRAVPGGAANVAANIFALGGRPSLLGVVGDDLAGRMLAESLENLSESQLVTDPSRPTTRKLRVLANHSHQVLRIDHEEEKSVGPEVEQELLRRFEALLPQAQVILISDYQKGCVTPKLIETIVAQGRQAGVPVVANPKPKSLPYYKGAALVSLNRFEAGEALGVSSGLTDEQAEESALRLRDKLQVERILITLGGSGMVAAGAAAYRADAIKVAVYDEAGAGDTVIATIALGVATGHFGSELLGLAAQTAGAVVQKVGVAVPSQEDLASI